MSENQSPTVSEPYILFELADTTYAIPSRVVRQMEMVEHITPVPNALPCVEGVVFARGEAIPTVNLRARFGFAKIPFDLHTRLVVVEHEARVVGLIVDAAREFVTLMAESVQPPPDTLTGLSGRYLVGLVLLEKRPVLLLDVAEILNLTELPAPDAPEPAA